MPAWWTRFTAHRRLARDLDDDIRAHLDLLTADYVRRGLTPEQAAQAARRDFGGIEQIKEAHRDQRGSRVLEHLWRDVSYAVRALRKSPGFTTAVVLTLALGIGANTAVFTLIDAITWRTLPVRDPESLRLVSRIRLNRTETGFTFPQFQAMHDAARGAELAGYSSSAFPVMLSATATDGVEPPITGQLVSGGYFDLLGVVAQEGRLIGPADDRDPNAHPVAVISDGYWRRRFARDPAIVGKTISLSGVRFDIIGVTPPEFFGTEVGLAPEVFVPMMMQPAVMPVVGDLLVNPNVYRTWVQILARIHPSVADAQVSRQLEPVYRQHLIALSPTFPQPARFGYEDTIVFASAAAGLSDLRQEFSTSLFILLAIVGIVLLVGCVNTANLLLVRAAARRAEMALRLALGAGRIRLLQQVLVEGAVLGVMGGAAGLFLAGVLTRALLAYASSGRTPIALDLSPDARVLSFTIALSMLCTLVFVFFPALRTIHVDVVSAINNANNGRAGSARLRSGKVLLVAQVALSLLLLVGAGLFVRTLVNLTAPDYEAQRDRVLIVRVEPRGSNQRSTPGTEERLHRLYSDLITRVGALPGVRSVSMGNVSPGKPDSGAGVAIVAGGTVRLDDRRAADRPTASGQVIYPDYFKTLGIRLRGRDFATTDLVATAAPVCIVNEAFVRIAFPDEDPLGKPCRSAARALGPYTIVGVADDSRYASPRAPVQPVIYTPFLQANTGRGQMILYVRTDRDASALAARVREEVWKTDSSVPQYEVRTLADEVDAVVVRERLLATISSAFSGLALLLTAIGLHGLLSFLVLHRTRELAIRMALGARRGAILGMIAREAVLLVGAGATVALLVAWMGERMMAARLTGILFGLTPTDGVTLAAAGMLLLGVAVIAASIPARRALTVDPMIALRSE